MIAGRSRSTLVGVAAWGIRGSGDHAPDKIACNLDTGSIFRMVQTNSRLELIVL